MVSLEVGLVDALLLGVVPFLVGDAIKAAAAALLLPGAWRLTAGRGSGARG
jgi:biotin transport system substrate-specific component